ncbi:hypothetical protein CEUSTIGMA_g11767.t1 [Chlamydomonas eustigma]|uniref:Sialate O-acetylesterase domain-containing protein n=1 Tax=Chlamydomonas eustigma TaxID=1157962 RepID=A0A250XMM4_9CHLO|nr:hypothetical protein CEUSTIGMA_g11767.t1 [Chlamydomonas eustigma]|eukprot:GAX84345.1 hypothetical protein CEUSTIGMA_g11767.t1 [Chlamydomonas eustigma]
MIWVQGESDTMSTGSSSMYKSNLQTFILAVRSTFSAYNPSLPIIMGVTSTENRYLQYPFTGQIRHAQQYDNPATPNIVKVDMQVGRKQVSLYYRIIMHKILFS